jgi:hypothetical protein
VATNDRYLNALPLECQSPADRFAHASLTAVEIKELFELPASLDLDGNLLAVHGNPTDDCANLT